MFSTLHDGHQKHGLLRGVKGWGGVFSTWVDLTWLRGGEGDGGVGEWGVQHFT